MAKNTLVDSFADLSDAEPSEICGSAWKKDPVSGVIGVEQVRRRLTEITKTVAEAAPDGKVLATGTNKPPLAYELNLNETLSAIADDPRWKYHILQHAERNAVLDALKRGVSLEGATMYGTLYPCADCARAIVASGIKRLVAPAPNLQPERDEKWLEHYRCAREVFSRSSVEVQHHSPADVASGATGKSGDA